MASNWSVTFAMALTTTNGRSGRRDFHDAGDAVDGGGILDRGAAELHHDHGSTAGANESRGHGRRP